MTRFLNVLIGTLVGVLVPVAAFAATADEGPLNLHLTASGYGIAALIIFAVAYAVVMVEEFTHLRKSKPVILAAGIIWAMIAWYARTNPEVSNHAAEEAFRHTFLEFAELFAFLLVAMTYINSMTERNVFEALRAWLVSRGFGFRKVFWITGVLAFFISPLADNLTTALLMCAVVMAVGAGNTKFISIACINVVVAANAGGAFSPFGDITTLMVWQREKASFIEFLWLIPPSVVTYVIPAALMHFAVPNEQPTAVQEDVQIKRGGLFMIFLFLITITMTVSGHQFLGMPPILGMLTGLSLLQIFGYYLKKTEQARLEDGDSSQVSFDIFRMIARAEWDTLLFFYGVLLCVGGLSAMGYMAMASEVMYNQWGATIANSIVGVLSAIVDNIPVMFAVLEMNPELSLGQWLLVTLTAGVGGSMLSIGSAAGVALMGQARGIYTFFRHLRWSWAILIGYIAGIYAHLLVNKHLFENTAQGMLSWQ